MAVDFTCDCGKRKPMDRDDLVEMGISQKMYCKGECEAKVQEFLDARDELHEQAAAVWTDGLKELYAASPDFELPDNHG